MVLGLLIALIFIIYLAFNYIFGYDPMWMLFEGRKNLIGVVDSLYRGGHNILAANIRTKYGIRDYSIQYYSKEFKDFIRKGDSVFLVKDSNIIKVYRDGEEFIFPKKLEAED